MRLKRTVVDTSTKWKAVELRQKKKRRRLSLEHRGGNEAIRVATEDAAIAASRLQNAVRNELGCLPAKCSYLCDLGIRCVNCFRLRSSTSAPAAETPWVADAGSAHDLVSRHMLHSDEVS